MKKFMLLLAGAILVSPLAYAIPNPTEEGPTIQDFVKGGALDTAPRIFVRVRNSDQGANNTSIAIGDAVVLDTTSDDGFSVVKSSVSRDGAIFGISVTTILTDDTGGTSDVGGRNWGYVQVYGLTQANVTAGGTNANAVGDSFITSSDAGKVTSATLTDKANGFVQAREGGFFLDAADTTSTSVDVFVNLM